MTRLVDGPPKDPVADYYVLVAGRPAADYRILVSASHLLFVRQVKVLESVRGLFLVGE